MAPRTKSGRNSSSTRPNKQVVYDYTYDGVMRSHEASLERIGVEAIDILLIHDVDT